MNFQTILNHLIRCSIIMKDTVPFIAQNKLWTGFAKQKLIVLAGLLLAILLPLTLISSITTFGVTKGVSETIFNDSHQYIVMFIITLLVTYFSHRTINLLSGEQFELKFKDYIDAQIRTLVLNIRNFVVELLVGIGVSIVVGIFGPEWLETFIKFLVSCYFLGYFFFDTYLATYDIKINKASPIIFRHTGAVFAVGLVTKLLFSIPFVGGVAAAFICTVATTYYMHTSEDRIYTQSQLV
jgi:hypothetical protein